MSTVLPAVPEATRRLVEEFIYAVARVIDEDRVEEFPVFFSADGVYKVVSRFNLERGLPFAQINCPTRGMIIDRVVSLRQANIFAQHRYRHVISGIHILPGDDELLSVRSNYLVARTVEHGSAALFSSGEYRDRIRIEDGVPRFRERVVVLDSKSIDTALVIPL